MKKFVLITLLLFSVCSSVLAGPKEDAMSVIEKWAKAFNDSDVDGIVSLYAPDALFFGTGSQTLVTKTEDVRKYFEQALLTNRPKNASLGEHSVMLLSDSTVVVTGLDFAGGTRDGKPYGTVGRISFVVAKRDGSWKIVHFHRSAKPS
jgi:uncharacterized protein (TIGR02246 family)